MKWWVWFPEGATTPDKMEREEYGMNTYARVKMQTTRQFAMVTPEREQLKV